MNVFIVDNLFIECFSLLFFFFSFNPSLHNNTAGVLGIGSLIV